MTCAQHLPRCCQRAINLSCSLLPACLPVHCMSDLEPSPFLALEERPGVGATSALSRFPGILHAPATEPSSGHAAVSWITRPHPPTCKWSSVKKYIKCVICLRLVLDSCSCSSWKWDNFRERHLSTVTPSAELAAHRYPTFSEQNMLDWKHWYLELNVLLHISFNLFENSVPYVTYCWSIPASDILHFAWIANILLILQQLLQNLL